MQEFMTSHLVDKEEHLEQLYSIFRRRHQKSYQGKMETSKRKHLFRHNIRLAQSLELAGPIHHNKKDGGMLIVKTVLCEFALAACNDS